MRFLGAPMGTHENPREWIGRKKKSVGAWVIPRHNTNYLGKRPNNNRHILAIRKPTNPV